MDDEKNIPTWAHEMRSDIRDIKTTLDLTLKDHEESLEKLENQNLWLQRAIYAIIIGAIASVLGL